MSESALVSIVKVLEEIYTPTGVTIWLNARNKHLDHRTPIELIDFGHYDRVLEVARAIEGVAGPDVSTKPLGAVRCDACGRRIDVPSSDVTWTSEKTYHTFCYENQHLHRGDVEWGRKADDGSLPATPPTAVEANRSPEELLNDFPD